MPEPKSINEPKNNNKTCKTNNVYGNSNLGNKINILTTKAQIFKSQYLSLKNQARAKQITWSHTPPK